MTELPMELNESAAEIIKRYERVLGVGGGDEFQATLDVMTACWAIAKAADC